MTAGHDINYTTSEGTRDDRVPSLVYSGCTREEKRLFRKLTGPSRGVFLLPIIIATFILFSPMWPVRYSILPIIPGPEMYILLVLAWLFFIDGVLVYLERGRFRRLLQSGWMERLYLSPFPLMDRMLSGIDLDATLRFLVHFVCLFIVLFDPYGSFFLIAVLPFVYLLGLLGRSFGGIQSGTEHGVICSLHIAMERPIPLRVLTGPNLGFILLGLLMLLWGGVFLIYESLGINMGSATHVDRRLWFLAPVGIPLFLGLLLVAAIYMALHFILVTKTSKSLMGKYVDADDYLRSRIQQRTK